MAETDKRFKSQGVLLTTGEPQVNDKQLHKGSTFKTADSDNRKPSDNASSGAEQSMAFKLSTNENADLTVSDLDLSLLDDLTTKAIESAKYPGQYYIFDRVLGKGSQSTVWRFARG